MLAILHSTFTNWNNQIIAAVARVLPNPAAYIFVRRQAPYIRIVHWKTYQRWRSLTHKAHEACS
ncbi:MAG: hypothetical protein H6876_06440 [Hyphomicrobiaceae bacterium]|nr:hypothetical protein [Hyphomicrobiaceae bacterium]